MLVSSVVAGVVVGLLARGDLRRLARLSVRYVPIFAAALGLRALAAFPIGETIARTFFVLSLLLLVLVAIANWSLPGAVLIGLGLFLNLAVTSANGGAMPVSVDAIADARAQMAADPLHMAASTSTVLPWLADVIPVAPLRNVYSFGDVLLSSGCALLIVRVMTRA